MKTKENGFTLVELLAVLAISGIIVTLLISVFLTGMKQSENTKQNVSLQQEANFVATALRTHHLEKQQYNLKIDDTQIQLDGKIISDFYEYEATVKYDGIVEENTEAGESVEVVLEEYNNPIDLTVDTNKQVTLIITFTHGSISYTLRTTLSRGV